MPDIYTYANPERTAILANMSDGSTVLIHNNCQQFYTLTKGDPDTGAPPVKISPFSKTVTVADIHSEADRRVNVVFPQWKREALLSQALALVMIGPQNWEIGHKEEANAIKAVWDWITSVHSAATAMETKPPANYTADLHWPANLQP